MDSLLIFSIAILIMSVVIHEVAHGYAALWLGDVTAKYAGRLTLNPIKHIDPFGSIILPILFALLPGRLILGWAKPVPYNPNNLKNQRWGELIVAAAGPLSNFLIAIIFGILISFSDQIGLPTSFVELSKYVVTINLVLAVFNLMPVPPLDGSKILFAILPTTIMLKVRSHYERYGLFLVLLLIFFVWPIISAIVFFLARILTGANF